MGTTMEQGWWAHLTKSQSDDLPLVGPTCQLHSTHLQDLLEGSGWPRLTKYQVDRPVMWAHLSSVTLYRRPHDEHGKEITNR